MRTVSEHLAACIENVGPLPPLEVMLPETVGCVLAEDIVAPFDAPVTDRAACDGYAVMTKDIAQASPENPVELRVIDELRAGTVDPTALISGAAIWIASGAPIPRGADAVVALNDTDQGETKVLVQQAVPVGENIIERASDAGAGQVILSKGRRFNAAQVALAASVGRLRVKVHPKPRVVIVSIGDELVEPGQEATPGSVFDANGHALATAAADAGADSFRVSAVPDEHRALREALEDQLVRADIIITTGGLSYGEGDTVKDVLAPLGTVRFDNVAMSPGRQLGVGTIGEGTPIFCLPGNPVAAQVAFEIFVRPAIRRMGGWNEIFKGSLLATIDKGWDSPAGRREFARVSITGNPKEGYQATLNGNPEDLYLSQLAKSNALAVVPEDVTKVEPGSRLTCMLLETN